MSLVVELPVELETELKTEASRVGESLSDYVVRLVQRGRCASALPRNGSELLAYWQHEGLLGSREEVTDSAAHARLLRSQAERRERE